MEEKDSNFKVEIKGSKVIIEAEFPTRVHLGDCLAIIHHSLHSYYTDRDGRPYETLSNRTENRRVLSAKPILDFAECIINSMEESFRPTAHIDR